MDALDKELTMCGGGADAESAVSSTTIRES